MNIVLFSPSWPQHSDANGIVTYCAHMKEALEGAGHQVFILSHYMHHECVEGAYKITYKPSFYDRIIGSIGERLFPGFEQYYYGAKGIVETLKKIQAICPVDILEVEESFGWHYYIARRVDIPVVMRLHGPHVLGCKVFGKPMDEYDRQRCRREQRAFKSASYVNAPSQWVVDEVKNRYAPLWRIARVFGNPIKLGAPDKRWNIEQCDQRKILFVGRFDLLKGGDVIIEALAKVMAVIPEVHLVFAGPDKGLLQADGSLLFVDDMLQRHIPGEQRGQIHCLGQVDKETIAQLRMQCHLSITASRSEVFGYTVVESMAAGMPVVAPNIAGVAELFEDNISGLYFQPGNADEMASHIISFMQDVSQSAQVGEQAYQRCVQEFSLEKIAEKAAAYYSDVIEAHKAGCKVK